MGKVSFFFGFSSVSSLSLFGWGGRAAPTRVGHGPDAGKPHNRLGPYVFRWPNMVERLFESAVSPKLAAWGELQFRKAFLILSYIGENQLEDIDDISADEIRSLKHLGMLDFEERVWESLGKKYIDKEDRLMVNVMF
ncbi:probable RNA-dependent RNA polymerase 3 [Corylus avellana]|uniref:probable RNA-dependent RNA polymerase 3 n=1 Tax=Corylus avellana TaxID=13451 RepID=UPI00286D646A|nr:probable RNA-dependent RNA polymerase 3 [Corylus avellana]